MEFLELTKILLFVVFSTLAVVFFLLGAKLLRARNASYKQANSLNKSFYAALTGTVPTSTEGTRDYQRAAGMAYNRRSKKIVFQGTLSNEVVQDVLR